MVDTQQSPDDLPAYSGVGGALAPDAATAGADALAEPAAVENATSNEDRILAIVAATRKERGDGDLEEVADMLAARFDAAGVDIDADRTVALAAEITSR